MLNNVFNDLSLWVYSRCYLVKESHQVHGIHQLLKVLLESCRIVLEAGRPISSGTWWKTGGNGGIVNGTANEVGFSCECHDSPLIFMVYMWSGLLAGLSKNAL